MKQLEQYQIKNNKGLIAWIKNFINEDFSDIQTIESVIRREK